MMQLLRAPSVLLTALLVAAVCLPAARADTGIYTEDDFMMGTCGSGKSQSPINIVTDQTKELPADRSPDFMFPTGTGAKVINKGTALQVEWDALKDPSKIPTIVIGGKSIAADLRDESIEADTEVQVVPQQFHFHSSSEHTIDGFFGGAELHIVSYIKKNEVPGTWGCNKRPPNLNNCVAVFAVLFKIGETSPPWFDTLFETAPLEYSSAEDQSAPYPGGEFDLTDLLPPGGLSHYTYRGSLTTPPCAEGLRWYVFENYLTITSESYRKMRLWLANTESVDGEDNDFRANNRNPQPLNGRTVYYVDPDSK